MKRDLTRDELEEFLKRSTDSLRMKPPDAVWKNLSKELHKRRRRTIAGIALFLLIASGTGYFIITNNIRETQRQTISQGKLVRATPALSDNQLKGSQPLTPLANAVSPETPQEQTGIPSRQIITAPSSTSLQKENPSSSNENTIIGDAQDDSFEPTVVDSYTEFEKTETATPQEKTEKRTETFPFTIESVINSYRARKLKRFETQFYFTPTISYRKLSENKSYLRTLDPATALASNYPAMYTSVNSNVTHKPDLGFELGFTGKYAVSKKVKVRGGLQFNVNRYEIKAFNSGISQATISFNGAGRDSLNTYSRYSNVGGYNSSWLRNLSFQLSAPVGIEYLFAGTDKVRFGIAGTVQPTYVLGDRAYLITTDYKSYTQVPWLVRRWNVNTAFETFVTYQGDKRTWQFGPQVRYQLLSSFVDKYPVKENLFDFGLKVGMTLGKR